MTHVDPCPPYDGPTRTIEPGAEWRWLPCSAIARTTGKPCHKHAELLVHGYPLCFQHATGPSPVTVREPDDRRKAALWDEARASGIVDDEAAAMLGEGLA